MFSFTQSRHTPVESAYPVIKETIPRSRLGYNSNNVYEGFPPLMSDGRAISAAYQIDTVTNQAIKNKNGIQSNWEYRRYLQKNANDILKENFREASNDCGYFQRFADPTTEENRKGKGYPYLYSQLLDDTRPPAYRDSDLKQAYLTREQLDAMKTAPYLMGEPTVPSPSKSAVFQAY